MFYEKGVVVSRRELPFQERKAFWEKEKMKGPASMNQTQKSGKTLSAEWAQRHDGENMEGIREQCADQIARAMCQGLGKDWY